MLRRAPLLERVRPRGLDGLECSGRGGEGGWGRRREFAHQKEGGQKQNHVRKTLGVCAYKKVMPLEPVPAWTDTRLLFHCYYDTRKHCVISRLFIYFSSLFTAISIFFIVLVTVHLLGPRGRVTETGFLQLHKRPHDQVLDFLYFMSESLHSHHDAVRSVVVRKRAQEGLHAFGRYLVSHTKRVQIGDVRDTDILVYKKTRRH